MASNLGRVLLVGLFGLPFLLPAGVAGPVTRSELGRSTKLRILVDKVMQPTAKWTTEEWMVKATAEAGFNVFCPRRGYDDLAAVRQVTDWCAKYGIYHMPWMRGSLAIGKGAGRRRRANGWFGPAATNKLCGARIPMNSGNGPRNT